MNPLPWSCRAVRTWRAVAPESSGAADHRRPRGFAGRHIAGCADCQRYFSRVATLDAALRSTAAARSAAPADDLHRRIMRAVAEAGPTATVRRRVPAPMLVGLGAAAVLAAITAMVQTRDHMATRRAVPPPAVEIPRHASPPGGPGIEGVALDSRSSTAPGAAAIAPTAEPLDRLAPIASALAQDPLQSEVTSVYADARYAVRFLALNFLPADAVADNRDQRVPGPELRRGGG